MNKDVANFDWEAMIEGTTARIHCSNYLCDHKKDSLTITRTYDGAIFNCFRCGSKGYVRDCSNPFTAKRKLARLRDKSQTLIKNTTEYFTLPTDFRNIGFSLINNKNPKKARIDAPKHILAYLYQYRLTLDDIIKYNIGFSKKHDGIIFPIYENDKLIAYLIRYINKDYKYKLITPDYIYNFNNNYKINKRILYKINTPLLSDNTVITKNYNLILCEDIISAIILYQGCSLNASVWALLTTNLPPVSEIKKYNFYKVILWLDYDAKIKALKHSQHLNFNGIKCETIITPKDPKDYEITYIRNKLTEKGL